MRRALWFRSLASFLAVWFPLIVGEPGTLHPCPMHGAASAHAAHSAHGAMRHAAMRDGAMPETAPGGPPAPHHDHAGCTCITCCAVSIAGLLAPQAPVSGIDVAIREFIATLPAAPTPPSSSATHVRPYPTGPPAGTLIG